MSHSGTYVEQRVVGPAGTFRVTKFGGVFHAILSGFVRSPVQSAEDWVRHPAALSELTRETLEARIAGFDPTPFVPEALGDFDGHALVRYGGRVYGIPHRYGRLDLNRDAERKRAGVVCGADREAVEYGVRANRAATPVEFLGWLPAFLKFGNCGTHPQFGHTQTAPPGYRFSSSLPPDGVTAVPPRRGVFGWAERLATAAAGAFRAAGVHAANVREFGVLRCLVTFGGFLRLVAWLIRKSGRVLPALRYAHSRHFRSQVMAPRGSELVFLTSVPYTQGQAPWVIEIEDTTTLFFPFVKNGLTAGLDIRRLPCFPMVKAVLEADTCRGILTHMRSTAEALPTLFESEIIARKVTYAPLGVHLPVRRQAHDDDGTVHLLFTNSWHQGPDGFYLRGGLDVLEAFAVLRERYPQLRLTMRTSLPALDDHYHRIIEAGWVRVINRFIPGEQMADLHAGSHIFLLPAARIHIVSVLQAMSYGLAVVGSDGWGMEEYLEDGRNGLVVRGRHGVASWADAETGMLREDYEPMYTSDPVVVAGIVEAVSRLVEDRELRRRLGRSARADVESKYNIGNWNRGMKAAFDLALGQGEPPAEAPAPVGSGNRLGSLVS